MVVKRIIKDTLILCLITLIAGAALGATHHITKDIIAEAKSEKMRAAYKEFFPEAADYVSCNFEENNKISEPLYGYYDFGDTELNDALKAVDAAGNTLGYVVTSTNNEGYGGAIQIVVGVDTVNMQLRGISFLTINETAGLGMKAKESAFKDQFIGKKIGSKDELKGNSHVSFEVVKTGNAGDGQIDAISGATRTSKAVTNAVNKAVFFATRCVSD